MDFSLTSVFVVPTGNTLPTTGSTQDLAAGQFGVFLNTYAAATAGNIAAAPYFYVAQGREVTRDQGTKRSDKIDPEKIVEWYKTTGSATARVQITEIDQFHVKCGETVTLTLRAHSFYIDALYYNGFTRSVTVQAPCCDCGADLCEDVDVPALIDDLIAKLTAQPATGDNPDNISFNTFYEFQRVGDDADAKLVISGKALTTYGVPCDISAFPHIYDRMWFRAFVYTGPDTMSDFIVDDRCESVANVAVVQRASYASGTSSEIALLEKRYNSYLSTRGKHLFTKAGYNQFFESHVEDGIVYDLYYIKYKPYKQQYTWGDYVPLDATVIIAAPQSLSSGIETLLEVALGAAEDFSSAAETTTTTTSTTTTSTTSTTTLIP